jgi:hypothetical protein
MPGPLKSTPLRRLVVGSVIGRYQSLADNRGVAPQSDRAGFLQSNQETLQCLKALHCFRQLGLGRKARPLCGQGQGKALIPVSVLST